MTAPAPYQAAGYAGEADLPAIRDLLNACIAADQLASEPAATVASVRQDLTAPEVDLDRDVRLWRARAGHLGAYGLLHIAAADEDAVLDAHLFFRVDPQARDQGLEARLVDWAVTQARAVAHERGQPAHLRAGLHRTTPAYIAYRQTVLVGLGFRPVRYEYKMARPLDRPIPAPRFPSGYMLRHVDGAADRAAWIEAFNWSFIDHWNHHPLTAEQQDHWLSSPHYRADGDLIAVAATGEVGGFCRCWIDSDDNAATGRHEGWIDTLGTRRGHRKIGLGRALLLAGLHWLQAQGLRTAVLDVDAANPSGALGLYRSAGFEIVNTIATYQKDL